jgi:hypothetical protein
MSAPTAYPLAWPAGKARTKSSLRERGRFSRGENVTQTFSNGATYSHRASRELTVANAVARVQRELDRLGARLPVLSTNLELRLDGLPRSGQRLPEDPGVAVYFQLKGKPLVLACDRYQTVPANLAAIAAHIDAMRTAERHGVGSLEQMFMGFAALPSGIAPEDWRAVLGEPKTMADAESAYREAIKTAHPDVGGSEARAAALNAAIAKAREVLR